MFEFLRFMFNLLDKILSLVPYLLKKIWYQGKTLHISINNSNYSDHKKKKKKRFSHCITLFQSRETSLILMHNHKIEEHNSKQHHALPSHDSLAYCE